MSILKAERQGTLHCPHCDAEQTEGVAEDYKALASWCKFERDIVECEECYKEFTTTLSPCEKFILVAK